MLINTLRSPRHALLIPAAVCLLVGGFGRTAAAKDCTIDSDCGTGYQCVPGAATQPPTGGATSVGTGTTTGPSGGGGAGGSVGTCPAGSTCMTMPSSGPTAPPADAGAAPSPNPPDGVPAHIVAPQPPPPSPTGTCEPKPIVCATVADCPSADFDCVLDAIPTPAIDPTCPAGVKCTTPVPLPPPPASTTGTCVAKMRACTAAADCPAPLTCQAQYTSCSGGGSVGPDGVVTTSPEVCTPGPLVCTWDPAACAADSDCSDPLYQCVKVGESGGSCTGGASACQPGLTCPAPLPPTCTSTPITKCLPRLTDCGSGQPCPAGWSCFDFSYDGGIPADWATIASGKACLPDGIIFVVNGHGAGGGQVTSQSGPTNGSGPVDAGGGKGGTATATATTTAPSTGGTPASPSNSGSPTLDAPTAKADAGAASPEPMSHSSGCSYGDNGAGQTSLWLALGMAGLVARLARRRNRER